MYNSFVILVFQDFVLIVFLVTVDFPLDSTTDTGLFEKIYTDTFVKHGNSAKTNTMEYYYYQPPKNTTKQLRKTIPQKH